MSAGCVGTKTDEALEEERQKQIKANDTNQDEANTEVEQTKKESTSDNQVTTSTTKTEKKTSTPTKTESCSHPSVTTKYVGLDKATGKVIYDTYCSKCGEYLGRVKY